MQLERNLRHDCCLKRKSPSRCSQVRIIETDSAGSARAILPGGRSGARARGGCTVELDGECLESLEALRAALVRVRREDHTLTTVASLAAVHPDRGRVVDLNSERGERGSIGSHGHANEIYANVGMSDA